MTTPQNDAGHAGPVGLFPPTFSQDYVEGAVRPFLLSGRYVGERPTLPMIDLELSKDNATGAHLFGMFYDGWMPNPEEDGLTVFIRGYEKRGPDNQAVNREAARQAGTTDGQAREVIAAALPAVNQVLARATPSSDREAFARTLRSMAESRTDVVVRFDSLQAARAGGSPWSQ